MAAQVSCDLMKRFFNDDEMKKEDTPLLQWLEVLSFLEKIEILIPEIINTYVSEMKARFDVVFTNISSSKTWEEAIKFIEKNRDDFELGELLEILQDHRPPRIHPSILDAIYRFAESPPPQQCVNFKWLRTIAPRGTVLGDAMFDASMELEENGGKAVDAIMEAAFKKVSDGFTREKHYPLQYLGKANEDAAMLVIKEFQLKAMSSARELLQQEVKKFAQRFVNELTKPDYCC